MADLNSSPFAILTFIAAPAVLTNAASLLATGTSQRFARNMDRARAIIRELEQKDAPPPEVQKLDRQLLQIYERRTKLLVRSLSLLYLCIGCFAAGSLTSLIGAVASEGTHDGVLKTLLAASLLVGVVGLAALVGACALLVRETNLATQTIEAEADFYRSKFTRAQEAIPRDE